MQKEVFPRFMNTNQLCKISLSTSVVCAAALLLNAAQAHHHGTDILHFFARAGFVNEGVVTNASGSVELNQNQQGHANIQRGSIQVNHLESNTTYDLLALTGDCTNFMTVTQFASANDGRASLNY